MGYLNKATITVDAILTNRGRQLLAEGGTTAAGLQITQFAVADDEIDYSLYNSNHPEGTGYEGSIIENMPVLEATPDEQQIMRYKLVTLPSNVTLAIAPSINSFEDIELNSGVLSLQRSPTVINTTSPETGYTLLVADATLVKIYSGTNTGTNAVLLNPTNQINANGSITIKLTGATPTITITTTAATSYKTGNTTATIFGNTTGATKTIPISVI